jgi:hypothetical protein
MDALFDKSKMPGQALDGNVFMNALRSSRYITTEVRLDDKIL